MAEHTQGAEFPNLGGGFLEPAFPVSTVEGFTQFGMTLRDYFAAQAVVASLARLENDRNLSGYGFSAVAEGAYAIADAMLAERAKGSTVGEQDRGGA